MIMHNIYDRVRNLEAMLEAEEDTGAVKDEDILTIKNINRLYHSVVNRQSSSLIDSIIKSLVKQNKHGTETEFLLLVLLKAIMIGIMIDSGIK
jgi:hypothetical protein